MKTDKFYQNPSVEIDTHTHTVLSGHAFSTLEENIKYASEIGQKGICITDHGHMMPNTTETFLPFMFSVIESELLGIRVLMGMELNILNMDGEVDYYNKRSLSQLEFCMGSIHSACFDGVELPDYTEAYLNAVKNPYIDVVGHPGNPLHPCDVKKVVSSVKNENKMIEINNHSFLARDGSRKYCLEFAKECIEQDVRICVASDAHFSRQIARLPLAFEMLAEINFPPELILNRTLLGFEKYLTERKTRIELALNL